jgi:CarD family transcriptional regulator
MFEIGNDIVHPCHGAGTIVGVQEMTIGDHTARYYVIDIPPKAMRVMVAVSRAEETGLRAIRSRVRLRELLSDAIDMASAESIETDYTRRLERYAAMLKEGSFKEVATVVVRLCLLRDRKQLGMRDMTLYDHGRHMLAGEIALAEGIDQVTALNELDIELEQMARRTRLEDALTAEHEELDLADMLEKRDKRRSTWSRAVTNGETEQIVRAAVELTILSHLGPLVDREREILGEAQAALARDAAEHMELSASQARDYVLRRLDDAALRALHADGPDDTDQLE